jgi:alpha-L-fucosidase
MSTYESSWESVAEHPLPGWYDDAKLGIFLHWGLYSVPGWAPQVPDIQQMLHERGPVAILRDNPYAEWYRNSAEIEGSPTWQHHRDTWGADFAYDDFVPLFDAGTADADLDAIAAVCRQAGARYVVLTTKHHEGFTLWPASEAHPRKGHYRARRDLVGGLSESVRAHGMRMGLYYSGGYDWPYNDAVLKEPADATLAVPSSPDYERYATAHVTELIDRYQPSVLWNDVCWPAGGNLAELFARYYNNVADGVVNDRWLQPTAKRSELRDAITRVGGNVLQAMWTHLPADAKSLTFPGANWYDFNTPEYASFEEIREKKWESTRGVGHSFGANRNERPEDIVTATELIRSFCDIVAKNGNLLIGIGPDEHGVLREEQIRPLRGLGQWLEANGDAVFATRPWHSPATTTTEGTDVRFTRRDDTTYALLCDLPGSRTFGLRGVTPGPGAEAVLLGDDLHLGASDRDGMLELTLPDRVPVQAAYAVRLRSVSWTG